MNDHLKYFLYLLKHKYFVFLACMKLKVPIRQALLHDLSKLSKEEWNTYVKYFTKRKKDFLQGRISFYDPDFDLTWNYHQKRNKHHYQYWLLITDVSEIRPVEIPEKYAREMIADWMGASRAKIKNWNIEPWVIKNCTRMKFHPKTVDLLVKIFEKELKMPEAAKVLLTMK